MLYEGIRKMSNKEDLKQYEEALNKIDKTAAAKKKHLAKEYALSHNPIKKGDIITDHIGSIRVDKLVEILYFTPPSCIYDGVQVTKTGKPYKSGKRRSVCQENLK